MSQLQKSFKLLCILKSWATLTLENISSTLLTVGSGGLIGFLVGFALKRVMKILAVIIGLFFGALIYLQSQTIINVNWDKLESISESSLSVISNYMTNTEQISTIMRNLGIPLAGGLSAGLVLGFSKG
jgi:uncharacterized membrane protein (Fun14 family)